MTLSSNSEVQRLLKRLMDFLHTLQRFSKFTYERFTCVEVFFSDNSCCFKKFLKEHLREDPKVSMGFQYYSKLILTIVKLIRATEDLARGWDLCARACCRANNKATVFFGNVSIFIQKSLSTHPGLERNRINAT